MPNNRPNKSTNPLVNRQHPLYEFLNKLRYDFVIQRQPQARLYNIFYNIISQLSKEDLETLRNTLSNYCTGCHVNPVSLFMSLLRIHCYMADSPTANELKHWHDLISTDLDMPNADFDFILQLKNPPKQGLTSIFSGEYVSLLNKLKENMIYIPDVLPAYIYFLGQRVSAAADGMAYVYGEPDQNELQLCQRLSIEPGTPMGAAVELCEVTGCSQNI